MRLGGVRLGGVRLTGVRLGGLRPTGVRLGGVRLGGVRLTGDHLGGVRRGGERRTGLYLGRLRRAGIHPHARPFASHRSRLSAEHRLRDRLRERDRPGLTRHRFPPTQSHLYLTALQSSALSL